MKLIKRFFTVALAASLALSVFPKNIVAASQPKWYYGETFDAVDNGFMPGSSSITSYNDKGNFMGVVEVPRASDKSVLFQIKTSNDCLMHKKFDNAMSGKVVWQATVRPDFNAGSSKIFYVYDSAGTSQGLIRIDTEGNILDINTASIGYQLPEGKFSTISIAMDFDKKTYSIFVNYKLRAADISLENMLTDMTQFRIHVTGIQKNCKTEFYISDMKVYEGSEPLSPVQMNETDWNISVSGNSVSDEIVSMVMGSKVGFFAGAPRAIVKGKVGEIDASDKSVSPFEKDGEFFVPLRFTSDNFGGTVSWNSETSKTSLIASGSEYILSAGDKSVVCNGKTEEISHAPQIRGGRLFVPASFAAKAFEKKLFTDSTGLIIFSNTEVNYTWGEDEALLKSIIGLMNFDRPTGEQILAAVEAKHPGNGHPRIYGTEDDFIRIKNEIAAGGVKKQWYDKIKAETEAQMKKTPVKYGVTDGIRMRQQGAQIATIVGLCSFMYKLTGETRYAERAWTEMEATFDWKDWNPTHFLDTGQMMNGFAIGYDWLYDWLTAEQREKLREEVVENGLTPILDIYRGVGVKDYDWAWKTPDNWTLECGSGAMMASLAICDEERDVSLDVMTNAMKSMEMGALAYAPDGPWYEGVSYWQLSTETLVEALTSLEASTGKTYGFLNSPGVAETGYYPYAMMGVYTFNFSDAGELTSAQLDTKELFYFSDKLGDRALANLRYERMVRDNIEPDFREFFYCKGEPVAGETDMKRDFYYRIAETVSMRNNWNTDSMLFAAMHAGDNAANHGHLDIGQFVIDSFGDRFAADLGYEDYNLPGTFFNKYRNRAEGHNTLLMNPDDRLYDQNFDAYATFERFESNDVSAFAITDMTCAYKDYVNSAKRGIKMTNGRTSVIVQDEVRSDNENEIYWFMNTKADVTLSEDGKTAILNINGNKMEAKLLSEEGRFTVMPAVPLKTSPQVVGQNENKDYRKLAIHFESTKDLDICVCFTPLVYEMEGGIKYPEVKPLAEWTLDDPSKVKIGELPKLYNIKIDGDELKGFDENKNFYSYALKKADSPMPKVEAEGSGEVTLNYPEQWPGVIEIKVKNEYYTNVYGIKFNVPPESLADKGFVEIDVKEVSASRVPQAANIPSNTLDNDFDTRYSCEMPADIAFDFGEEKDLQYVSLAFYGGAVRKCHFCVETSNDGSSWTKVFEGVSSGESAELENFYIGGAKTRYVRITGTGLQLNGSDTIQKTGWFSLTEFKAYTSE